MVINQKKRLASGPLFAFKIRSALFGLALFGELSAEQKTALGDNAVPDIQPLKDGHAAVTFGPGSDVSDGENIGAIRGNEHGFSIAYVLQSCDWNGRHRPFSHAAASKSGVYVHADLQYAARIIEFDTDLCGARFGVNARVYVRDMSAKKAARKRVRRNAGSAARL